MVGSPSSTSRSRSPTSSPGTRGRRWRSPSRRAATGARRELAKLESPAAQIIALADGKRIAAARLDGSVSVLDGATGDVLRRIDVSRPDALLAIGASGNGKSVVVAGTHMIPSWI